MKTFYSAMGLLWLACNCVVLAADTKEGMNQPTHGYFKCKYGKLEIIDAMASFSVTHEDSETYSLAVKFCYEPMTAEDVKAAKAAGGIWGMSIDRRRALKVEGFPGHSPNLFFTLGDWPIGQAPPNLSTNVRSISLTANGSRGMRLNSLPSGVQILNWSSKPDGDQYVITGRFVGNKSYEGDDKWEWDISFEARTVNWSVGRNGLSPRGDVPASSPTTNASPSQPDSANGEAGIEE